MRRALLLCGVLSSLWYVGVNVYVPLQWPGYSSARALRVVGGLLIAYGLSGVAWLFAPMHPRGAEFGLTDAAHIALGACTVLLMLVVIVLGAATLGSAFRRYSIATIVVLLVSGLLTGMDSPNIAANLPTPWIGVWERISIAAFLLWIAVLAVALLRENRSRG